jgi:VanZ family protein
MPARRTAVVVAALAGLYLLTMFLGTHLPMQGASSRVVGVDKVVHFGMYAGLAVLILAAASFFRPISIGAATALLLVIAVYAAADEWTQGFVPTRTADVWDWAADVAGAAIGAAAFLVARPFMRQNQVNT